MFETLINGIVGMVKRGIQKRIRNAGRRLERKIAKLEERAVGAVGRKADRLAAKLGKLRWLRDRQRTREK